MNDWKIELHNEHSFGWQQIHANYTENYECNTLCLYLPVVPAQAVPEHCPKS